MSDNYLSFVPTDIEWVPKSDVQIEELVSIAWDALPEAEEVEPLVHNYPAFVHPVQNLETVACPHCNSDLAEWFWSLIDDDEGGYQGEQPGPMIVEVPCCKQQTSLTDLRLDLPGAFGRFQLDVMNPDVSEVPGGLLEKLESLTGQKFQSVWTHI